MAFSAANEDSPAGSEPSISILLNRLPGVAYRAWNTPDWDVIWASGGLFELTGYSEAEFRSERVRFGDLIHPEDRERVWDTVQRAVGGSRAYELRYRIRKRDGSERWVWGRGQCVRTDKAEFLEGFIHDVTEQVRTEEALRASEERFRQLAENIREVFWAHDPVLDRTLYTNPAFESVWGIDRDVLYSERDIVINSLHPEDREAARAAWHRQSEGEPAEVEYRVIRPSGEVRWIRDRGFPVRDAEGRVYRVVGIAEDVTERRRSEDALRSSLAEKEVLLREIHHRVKNNLQIISSLLRLEARSAKSPEVDQVFQESQARIRSMALLHEMLYRRRNLDQIAFTDYVRSLAAHLLRVHGTSEMRVRVEVEGDLMLNLDTAVLCGLIVNELLSNSLKHAFPRGRGGRVDVALERESAPGVVRITVSDDGEVPLAGDASGPPRGVGLHLVELLAAQLGGAVNRSHGPGTSVTIEFPQADSH